MDLTPFHHLQHTTLGDTQILMLVSMLPIPPSCMGVLFPTHITPQLPNTPIINII